MFDDLNEIIKSDSESQEKFKQFKVNFWNKRAKKRKDEKRRTRMMSIILASSAVVSIVFGIYAIKAQTEAGNYEDEIAKLRIELQDCSDK